MAVTLENTPKELYAAHNKIVMELSIDDFGTDPESNFIAWQLRDNNDNNITEVTIIRPFEEGENVTVDLSRDVKGFVHTAIIDPENDPQTLFTDLSFFDSFKFVWGEYTYNEDTEDETLTMENEEEFTIINVALQTYELDKFDGGVAGSNYYIFNSTPPYMKIHSGHYEYLWIHNVTSYQIQYFFQNPANNVSSLAINVGGGFCAIPISISKEMYDQVPAVNIFPYHTLIRTKTIITLPSTNTVEFIRDYYCNDSEKTSYKTVEFLSPNGGRGSISFEEVAKSSGSSSEIVGGFMDYDVSPTVNDYKNPSTVGGRRSINNIGQKSVSLSTLIPYDEQTSIYFDNFAAATEYHICEYHRILNMTSGEYETTVVKKKLSKTSSNIQTYQENGADVLLTFTGVISNELNTQSEGR